MVQATTPTFVLTLPNTVDLSIAQNIYFSIEQGQVKMMKTGTDLSVDGQNVSVYFSQAETLQFKEGNALIQLNWTYPDGSRACTFIKSIPVGKNLINEVLE